MGRFFSRVRMLAAACAGILMVSGCGGGGGGGGGTNSGNSGAISYTAAAMVGELLTYTLDTTKLTYRYTIIDSVYGLDGATGSGDLILNSDDTYSLSGIDNARVFVLPNGLVLGAIRELIEQQLRTIPVFGVAEPVSTVEAAAGTYNFMRRSCIDGVCTSAYGTFRINPDATWSACAGGDLGTGCGAGRENHGSVNLLGGGQMQLLEGAAEIGTAIVSGASGQNLILIDLTDTRATGTGVGMLIGFARQSIDPTGSDGTWITSGTYGAWGALAMAGENRLVYEVNGSPLPSPQQVAVNFDNPWPGFYTVFDNSGPVSRGISAGAGLFAEHRIDGAYGDHVNLGVRISDLQTMIDRE